MRVGSRIIARRYTYLYHSHYWRRAASYVALTRQRHSAQVFVARDTARDTRELARQMARGEIKAASIAWATREELTAAQRREHARMRSTAPEDSLRAKVRDVLQRREASEQRAAEFWGSAIAACRSPAPDSLTAKVRAASETRQQRAALPAPEWLIPPYVSRDGHDSLGRGLDPASIAAAADTRVQQAKSEPWRHLERAYRDPHMAQAQLNEIRKA